MKIKDGFTLIELLAVIMILGLVGLIAIPTVNKTIRNAKEKLYDSQVKMIKTSAKKWAIDNINELLETNTLYLDLSQLIDDGYIEQSELIDPRSTKNTMNGCIVIEYNDSYNTYEYEYVEGNCYDIKPIYADNTGASVPELTTGMIPVKWNGTNWVKVDIKEKWYDYDDKEWANAVTVTSTNRAAHLSAEPGTVIPMSDITTMWVWIPRYAYQITSGFHTSNAGVINVKFLIDKTDTTIDGTVIEETPTYNGDSQTNYVTHPAFTFGTEEVTGIWVAKFEPSVADQSDLCYTSPSDINCNRTDLVAKIIPNAISWRYITVGNAFTVALAMKSNSLYGLDSNQIDTHLMKNDEWGAVAYLSKSRYGKADEIWINPADNYTTGCAGSSVSATTTIGCVNTFDTENGQQASTTGNIYGIYDMSGGAWERVSAYLNSGHANLAALGSSILSADNKYKNVYSVGTSDIQSENYAANSNKFGDALYETSSASTNSTSWFADISYMTFSAYTWFGRGGAYTAGAGSGLFGFSAKAPATGTSTFRPVFIVNE